MGGETNATTGWTQVGLDAGANVFESQDSVKNVGEFALHTDANDTPTANCEIYVDMQAAPFNISNGDVVRLSYDRRHIGSNDRWGAHLSSSIGGTTNEIEIILNTEITFTSKVYYWTHTANHRYLNFRERGINNNGGIYLDNKSVRKVTFS